MRIGSLFSGIGGLELGLERAGVGHVVWQCEIDSFCRQVLAKHWPNVERFEDVTKPREWPAVDLICGGFPCQDVSSAGKRRGIDDGPKSSLWKHFRDIVEAVRPAWVVVENVTSGAKLWLRRIRHDLHMLGYRTTAFALSAADVGAPHLRRRIFVVAHPRGIELREQSGRGERSNGEGPVFVAGAREARAAHGDADRDGEVAELRGVASGASAWASPPEFRGVDDGVPRRLDRLRALGNAVVPQCAEVIGRMIVEQRRAA